MAGVDELSDEPGQWLGKQDGLAADVVAPLRAAGYGDAAIARLGGPLGRHNDLRVLIR